MDGLLLVAPMIVPDTAKRTLPPHSVLVRDKDFLAELEPDEAKFFEEMVEGLFTALVNEWLDRVEETANLLQAAQ